MFYGCVREDDLCELLCAQVILGNPKMPQRSCLILLLNGRKDQ